MTRPLVCETIDRMERELYRSFDQTGFRHPVMIPAGFLEVDRPLSEAEFRALRAAWSGVLRVKRVVA